MKTMHGKNILFLNNHPYPKDVLVEIVHRSKIIPDNLRPKIIPKINEIVGNQEIKWININSSDADAYILYRYKFKNYPKEKILEPFPLHLLIEPSSICNLRCKMCFQTDRSFTTKGYMGFMDITLFKNIIDQAVENRCQAVTLASRGEPTLHPKFEEMLQYCKGKFFELKINTNAYKLTEKLSRCILDCGVDIVVFSVDGYTKEEYEKVRMGARFDDVVNNIKQFARIKRSNPRYNKTVTRISQTVFRYSEEDKKRFLSFWRKKVDDVCYNEAHPRGDSYNNPRLNYDKPCYLLWERLYVWHDGICNPCDFDYKSYLKAGSAKTHTIKEIWNGRVFTKLRQLHLSGERSDLTPCCQCNVI